MATDTLVQIKTPIWNGGDGRRAIGVATFKVPCMVEIIYKDSTGFRPAVIVCEKYALNIMYRDVVNTTTLDKNLDVYSRFTVDDLNAVDYL